MELIAVWLETEATVSETSYKTIIKIGNRRNWLLNFE